jgi:hypothetical protein
MELIALEAALREKLSASSVEKIEGFPCDSYSDFLTQHRSNQLHVLTAYDPGAFDAVASTSERMMQYLLTWSPALVVIALIVVSITQSSFSLLLGIPLAFLGFLLTTPGAMRSFGSLLLLVVSGTAVYSWFQGNRTVAYVLGAYAASNFLGSVARQQCDMALREAIGRSEIVLVWLYLKGSVVIKKRSSGQT